MTVLPSKRWLQQREGAVDKAGQHVPVSAISPACDEQTETKAQHTPKTIGQFVTERMQSTYMSFFNVKPLSAD